MAVRDSRISGFFRLTPVERLRKVAELVGLTEQEVATLQMTGSMGIDVADKLVENVISTLEMPLSVAPNFRVNGKDYLVPMAIEEPSVVAACSNAARIAREGGGFRAYATEPLMYGQVQVIGVPDPNVARVEILSRKSEILELANTASQTLKSRGAGARDLQVREVPGLEGQVVVHLVVDVMDAMGANVINTMCERVAPLIEEVTGGRVNLRILSNLTPLRTAYAWARFRKELIGGEEVVNGVVEAWRFAQMDIFRAATHNKGIMNGIDAVLVATLNDWRAAEANAHAYAAIGGYRSLTRYSVDSNGNLIGSIEVPLAVGVVGGTTGAVEKARIARKILGASDARELACILASVGLAQNFAALRALADEGIQRGHMSLHARNVAVTAGASPPEVDAVAKRLVEEGRISVSRAREILQEMRGGGSGNNK
ncbi:3-hydroxy-3-methylglutaryl-CoA reductase [Thermogymnomonas acidicola]|uniref:3-hydroxy-3-methylglutaryl-CoA reductase n=1 Tax=Thermogymnomonas acidicola TaxID=399579 RepID=A0AA37F9G8_9ARCH|nr:hydroxymethylglutaryl-CoA reductase, degradative [Thermogymnomonas acidicola]GGM74332.1 3-hydroxy-3-methylglutaryl-CoA reductase [Thermogymnomonas acidicola]